MQKPLFSEVSCASFHTKKKSWNKILNRTSLQDSDVKTHIESFTEDLDQFGFSAGDFQQLIGSDESDSGF